MKNVIEVKDIVKKFGKKLVLNGLSFEVCQGSFISIIGPNGCGKSTLLNIIAGMQRQTAGEVVMPKGLKIGFVFQDYKESLLPWRTVYCNIKLPLELSGRAFDASRVDSIIREFNLASHKKKFPHQLSGGFAQLTAIARALVNKPDVLILDEPFKSLDFDIARRVIRLLLGYCEKNRLTTIMISHDLGQAVLFADRVIVLSKTPCMISETIEISLPRPRQLELCQDELFFRIKNKVVEAFKNANK